MTGDGGDAFGMAEDEGVAFGRTGDEGVAEDFRFFTPLRAVQNDKG